MSFPAYEEYKDSGIEWLGEVPEHWKVIKGGFIGTLFGSESVKEDQVCEEGNLPFIKVGSMSNDTFEIKAWDWFVDPVVEKDYRTRSDYVVFPKRGAAIFLNKVNVVDRPSLIDPNLMGWEINERADSYFIAYLLKTRKLDELADVSTVPQINNKHIAPERFPVPPVGEQKAIVAYLNAETSKIDSLVSEQRRLIELLKEKRQAVISHAVTKGLDPSVPMKESGIEWLGDVPEGWEVVSVRRVLAEIEQGWSPQCDSRPADEDEWGILKTGCVNRGIFSEMENKALPKELEPIVEYEVKPGDVLMSRASGSPDLVGATAFVYEVRPNLMLSDKTFRIHLAKTMEPKFFVAVFNSQLMRAQIEQSISGAEGLANNLPQSKLKCFALALPPINEQVEIVRELALRCQRFDTLIAQAERAIELLQERRTALISAAVTGKIDVREFAHQETA